MTIKRQEQFGDCSVRLLLNFLWLPRTAMRPAEPEISHTDCILVVGISRPKFAALFLALIMTSLFLTFHMLYDNALYNIQTASSKNRLPISPSAMLKINYQTRNSIDHNSMLLPNQFHFPKTTKRLPQTLIIGVRKCGTRALLEMLYLHPRIQKASGEVHFFDRDENYMRGLEWYRKKMPPSFRGQITIEKSPSYFVSPEVPERIRAMNASIKLLLIVREPVTRAISDYTQLRSHAATASLPMETPLHQRSTQSMGKQRTSSHSGSNTLTTLPVLPASSRSFEELAIFINGTVNDSYRPLTTSMYHLHLHRWLEAFSREQIFIVNGDQLIHNPVSQLRKIETFLGIEHRINNKNFYFNKTKGFYCLRYHSGDRCLRETKGRKHPYINPGIISKLRKFFADHNQKFYELIGEDFGWPEE